MFGPHALAQNASADSRSGLNACLKRGQHVRGGSPREGARSELASGAATGGGGPQVYPVERACERSGAPPTRTQCVIRTSISARGQQVRMLDEIAGERRLAIARGDDFLASAWVGASNRIHPLAVVRGAVLDQEADPSRPGHERQRQVQ